MLDEGQVCRCLHQHSRPYRASCDCPHRHPRALPDIPWPDSRNSGGTERDEIGRLDYRDSRKRRYMSPDLPLLDRQTRVSVSSSPDIIALSRENGILTERNRTLEKRVAELQDQVDTLTAIVTQQSKSNLRSSSSLAKAPANPNPVPDPEWTVYQGLQGLESEPVGSEKWKEAWTTFNANNGEVLRKYLCNKQALREQLDQNSTEPLSSLLDTIHADDHNCNSSPIPALLATILASDASLYSHLRLDSPSTSAITLLDQAPIERILQVSLRSPIQSSPKDPQDRLVWRIDTPLVSLPNYTPGDEMSLLVYTDAQDMVSKSWERMVHYIQADVPEGLDPARPTLDPKLVSHVLGYIQLGPSISPFWISTSDATATLYDIDIQVNGKQRVKELFGEIFKATLVSDWQHSQPEANWNEGEEMDEAAEQRILGGYRFQNRVMLLPPFPNAEPAATSSPTHTQATAAITFLLLTYMLPRAQDGSLEEVEAYMLRKDGAAKLTEEGVQEIHKEMRNILELEARWICIINKYIKDKDSRLIKFSAFPATPLPPPTSNTESRPLQLSIPDPNHPRYSALQLSSDISRPAPISFFTQANLRHGQGSRKPFFGPDAEAIVFDGDMERLGGFIPDLTLSEAVELFDDPDHLVIVTPFDTSTGALQTNMSIKEYVDAFQSDRAPGSVLGWLAGSSPLRRIFRAPQFVRDLQLATYHNMQGVTPSFEDCSFTSYVLSPPRSWTDFHVDFSGSSSWVHIIEGVKVWYLVKPDEKNLSILSSCLESGTRDHPDNFSDVKVVVLRAGQTFFMPAGTIHAVYTAERSVMVCGDFLTPFCIPIQSRIWEFEKRHEHSIEDRYPEFLRLRVEEVKRWTSVLSALDRNGKLVADPIDIPALSDLVELANFVEREREVTTAKGRSRPCEPSPHHFGRKVNKVELIEQCRELRRLAWALAAKDTDTIT